MKLVNDYQFSHCPKVYFHYRVADVAAIDVATVLLEEAQPKQEFSCGGRRCVEKADNGVVFYPR